MGYRLLLVDANVAVTTPELQIRQLREFSGTPGLSVHFRPVRSDRLFESAKAAGQLAYRVLAGEGVVRSQLWVEYEVIGDHVNVTGRSSDLLFALSLILSKWNPNGGSYPAIAATGTLNAADERGEAMVGAVQHTTQKIAAAVACLAPEPQACVFYPAANEPEVTVWRRHADVPGHIHLYPVSRLEEALSLLGISLEKVYLGNPFRGLEPFDYKHRSVFFGRDREVSEVAAQLLRRESLGEPGLLVEGASGSGKSSFLRAGVLPALIHPQHLSDSLREPLSSRPIPGGASQAVWRPGLIAAPVDEPKLSTSIYRCWRAYQELPELGTEQDGLSLQALRLWRLARWPSGRRFVWVIDQLEELFALVTDAPLVERLGGFLSDLQREGVWTLASIRADAVANLKAHSAFRQVFGANEGQYYLALMRGTALDEVISLPAKAADLAFGRGPDGKALDQLLREDAYREADSLPLLQFTLYELYRRRDGRVLTHAAYQDLGGLTGSITTMARAILGDESTQTVPSVQRLFRSLVSVDDQGRATRRYAPLAEIEADSAQYQLIKRLVDARLCVTDQREGTPVAAFAHDTLLDSLPALTDWLKRESSLLQSRELAEREARLWQQHGESDAWLASSDKVASFSVLESAGVPLADLVRTFIVQSRRRARRTTRIKQAAVAAITVLALIASVAGWIATQKQHEAEFQTLQTQKAQLRVLTEAAGEHLKDDDIAFARGVILEVLNHPLSRVQPDPAAVNVFQEIRANDPAVAILALPFGAGLCTSYSPDGTRIVTASNDPMPRVWDALTGIEVGHLPEKKGHVGCAIFSPDSAQLAAVSSTHVARIMDAKTGAIRLTLPDVQFRAIAYSRDGQRLAVGSTDGKVRILNANTGNTRLTINTKLNALGNVAFSPDGTMVAGTADDKTVRIWNSTTGSLEGTFAEHRADVNWVVFSPDGSKILTASSDGDARTFDVRSGRLLLTYPGLAWRASTLYGASFSPDGKKVVTASTDGTARVWNAETGAVLKVLSGHQNILWSAAFSPDSKRVVTGAADATVRVWDVKSESPSTILNSGTYANDAQYSPDGQRLLLALDDKTGRILDARSGAEVLRFSGHGDAFNSATYSPDGARILTSSGGSTAHIWDAKSGELVRTVDTPGSEINLSRFFADGRRFVTVHDLSSFRIWDGNSTEPLLAITNDDSSYVTNVAVSPDGRSLASTSLDFTVRIWDTQTGVERRVFSKHGNQTYSAMYSVDGRRILSASSDRTARIWEADTGKELAIFTGHRGRLNSAAFSPDEKTIATASADNTLRIWEAATGLQLHVLKGHERSVDYVTYSRDGSHLLTTSLDNTVRLWDARPPASFPDQVAWAEAVESDPLPDVQRRQLGLTQQPDSSHAWPDSTECDDAAGSYYDPQRRSPGRDQDDIGADIAKIACIDKRSKEGSSAHAHYLIGRTWKAKKDFSRAQGELESAWHAGYPAAAIDLADLFVEKAKDAAGAQRAVALYEQAWRSGIAIAAFRLGHLYEVGILPVTLGKSPLLQSDEKRAWEWYQRGLDAGEPNSLGRFADRWAQSALQESTTELRDADLLRSLELCSRAVKTAHSAQWPEHSWRQWRYHRSSLGRFLASVGKMTQVAEVYWAAATPRL